MPTQIAPSAVQLAPASQPEEKIQELAISHDQVIYNAAQSVENTEEIEGDQNNG